jgi:hypothetical protein
MLLDAALQLAEGVLDRLARDVGQAADADEGVGVELRVAIDDRVGLSGEPVDGDKPFEDLDRIISQAELKRLSDDYKSVAGFAAQAAPEAAPT